MGIRTSPYLHNVLRVLYLAAVSLVGPLAILNVMRNCMECLSGAPGIVVLVTTFVAGPVWALFFIFLSQLSFPRENLAAFHVLAALLLNAALAHQAGPGTLYFAAFSIMGSAVLAQFLFFAIMTIRFMNPELRTLYFTDTYSSYGWVPSVFALLVGAFATLLFKTGLRVEPVDISVKSVLAVLMFFYNVLLQLRCYLRENLFLAGKETVLEPGRMDWKAPAAIAATISVLISILVLIVSNRANQ
ncbi:MAG: hypothetical protein JNM27_08285 [Leptospirales bacterium]|nr:hypothetical protein [Leptospirales bacterium]